MSRYTGPPMDLANMRSLGVTRVDAKRLAVQRLHSKMKSISTCDLDLAPGQGQDVAQSDVTKSERGKFCVVS
jgi:hypothetical protein